MEAKEEIQRAFLLGKFDPRNWLTQLDEILENMNKHNHTNGIGVPITFSGPTGVYNLSQEQKVIIENYIKESAVG